MSAETLRRAAALMRERAEGATGVTHHWSTGRADGSSGLGVVLCGMVRIAQTDETLTGGPSNAEHIASWHPAVALAVADWLEAELDACQGIPEYVDVQALAVARAYLGADA